MTVLSREPYQPEDGELLLRFQHSRIHPLRAADLGELLQNIARDYKQINRGQELVIYRLIEGSVWAILRDASGLASGATSVVKFGRAIVSLYTAIRDSHLVGKKKTGIRTIESLAKIAADSGASVEFQYRKSVLRGEEVSFRIEPIEAKKIQAKVLAAKQPPNYGLKAIAGNSLAPARIGSELARLARAGGDSNLLETIARVLVDRGADHLVEEIAAQLEIEGHFETAQMLREIVKKRPDLNPPLLT